MKSPLARASRSQPTSPYKGLAPFDDSELDVLLFFGRERERAVITANLVATRVTVLYGASGVGKSSVLRAAVKPSLAALPEHPLVVYHDTWSGDPSDALAGSIAAASGIEPRSLSETLDLASARHGDVFVLLDQAEEYFTYHAGSEAMGAALAELATRTELPMRVLIGIREDALARLDGMKRQVPGLLANCLRLDHLSREAGREAIRGPVERFAALVPDEQALAIEPGLTDAVLDGIRAGALVSLARGQGAVREAADQQRVEAPYLQVVMQRLWEVERAAGSRVLRLQTLEELGGPARIVQDHLALALGTLTPEQKVLAARMFNHLVTPSGTKIAHGDADLAGYAAVSAAELQPVLAALGRERILRPIGGDGGQQYEIFHDVLADAVLAWRGDFDANQALERERAEARRRHRRLIGVIVIALIALAAMTGIAGYALVERNAAQQNAAQAKAAQANAETQADRAQQQSTKAQNAEQAADAQAARAEAAQRKADAAKKREIAYAQRASDQQQQAEKATRQAQNETNIANTETKRADISAAQARTSAVAALAAKARAQRSANDARLAQKRAITQRNRAHQAELYAKGQERNARTQELVYQSQSLLGSNPEESLRLALQAERRDPNNLIESALRQALIATRGLRVLRGGGSPVKTAAYSPDGGLIVTAGPKEARVFDARTGRHVATLQTNAAVSSASFSPDGTTVVTVDSNDRADLWSTSSWTRTYELRSGHAVTSAAFSRDSQLVVTTSASTTTVWRIATGAPVTSFGQRSTVVGAAFSRDGNRVVSFGPDRMARVNDIGAGKGVFSLDQTAAVTDAVYSPDGSLIVTTGRDGTARLWDAATGQPKAVLGVTDEGPVTSAAFSPDSTALVTPSTDGDVRVWDTRTGTLTTTLTGHLTTVPTASFSPDGNWIVTAGSDGSARVWEYPSGIERASLLRHTAALTSASFSPNGATIVTSSNDGTARTWDAAIDRPLRLFSQLNSHVAGLAYSPDGKLLASAGDDGVLRLWSTSNHQLVREVPSDTPLEGVAFSRDGKLVAAAGIGVARVWRVANGGRVAALTQTGPVHAVAFSADGKRLVTAGADDVARIRPLAGGPGVELHHPGAVTDVAVSPNGQLVATACADGVIRLWTPSGALVKNLMGHLLQVNSVAFSPDGKHLVSGSDDHDIRIWNVATGKSRRLHGPVAPVNDVQFSPDGRWVVDAGPAAAGIWSVQQSGLQDDRLFYLSGHTNKLRAVAWAPTGWRIATASNDGTIRTYACKLCEGPRGLAKQAAQRLADLKPRG